MRLLNEIEKDAKIFYREGRTVTLLIVVPIIIMLVLSAVFGKTTGDPKLNIKIGFCDLDKTNLSKDFIAGIETSKIVDISDNENCNTLAQHLVATGKLPAAVVLPQGFEQGIKKGEVQEIKLILDNTRIQTAPSIEGFFKASASSSSQRISIEYVSVIWKKLEEADARLDGLKNDVSDAKTKANDITVKLTQTKDQLESIDFSIMTNALDGASQTVDQTVASLNSANENLTAIESRFANYDKALIQSENDLLNISILVDDVAISVSNTSSLLNCTASDNASVCGSVNAINASIGNVKTSVDDRLFKIRLARQELNDTNQTVQEFKGRINESLVAADNANLRINDLNRFVETLQENRRDALITLNEALDASELLLERTDQMSSLIDNAKQQIKEITARRPQAVVSPIDLNTANVFEKKTFFEFLLPGLIPIILMFLSLFLSSTSLVREKTAGTLERVFISQISSIEYAAIKIVSYAIVLFPQLVILLAMASLLYNAFSIDNYEAISYLVIVGVLMMIVFNALGFIIAAYSDSEATAFLASLVVGLPLLFMSGLIFPFDFMPSFMANAGEASPLSQGIIGMQSIITYGTANASIVSSLFYYVLVLNAIAIIVIRMRMRG